MAKYCDLNTDFKISLANNDALMTDISAIKSNLQRLFTTGKGEVPFNREYGTTLKSLLFENSLDPSDVVMFLYMDITTFEPRVSLSPADINIVKSDQNTYTVYCNFTVPSLGDISGSLQSTVKNQ